MYHYKKLYIVHQNMFSEYEIINTTSGVCVARMATTQREAVNECERLNMECVGIIVADFLHHYEKKYFRFFLAGKGKAGATIAFVGVKRFFTAFTKLRQINALNVSIVGEMLNEYILGTIDHLDSARDTKYSDLFNSLKTTVIEYDRMYGPSILDDKRVRAENMKMYEYLAQ